MVTESLLILVIAGVVIAGLVWVRGRWSGGLDPAAVVVDGVIGATPTDVSTPTALPSPADEAAAVASSAPGEAEGGPPAGDMPEDGTPAASAPEGPTPPGAGAGVPEPSPPTPEPLPTPTRAPATSVHVIESGDSLYAIAIRYGITIDDILAANEGMTIDSFLGIGQELRIPAAEAEGAAEVADGAATEPPATADATTPDAAVESAGAITGTHGSSESTAVDVSRRPTVDTGEPSGAPFPAPRLLAPGDGRRVVRDLPFLRWTSVGVLPRDAYYVVSIREVPDAGAADVVPTPAAGEAVTLEWVLTNATAVRVPSALRPTFGADRTVQWTVSVRRRGTRLVGDDEGAVLSAPGTWWSFTWSPGEEDASGG